jgi:hypothetical protein
MSGQQMARLIQQSQRAMDYDLSVGSFCGPLPNRIERPDKRVGAYDGRSALLRFNFAQMKDIFGSKL